jgi:hypothetical protein
MRETNPTELKMMFTVCYVPFESPYSVLVAEFYSYEDARMFYDQMGFDGECEEYYIAAPDGEVVFGSADALFA